MLSLLLFASAFSGTDTTPPVPRDFDALPEGEEKDELRRQMRTTPSESTAGDMEDPFVDSTYLDGNYGVDESMRGTGEWNDPVWNEPTKYTLPAEKDLVAAVRLYSWSPSGYHYDPRHLTFIEPSPRGAPSRHQWSQTQPTCRVEVVGSPHKSGLTRVQRRDVRVQAEYMKVNLPDNATLLAMQDMAKMLNSTLNGISFTRGYDGWEAGRMSQRRETRSIRRPKEREYRKKVLREIKTEVQANNPAYQTLNLNVLYKRPGYNSRPPDTLASRATQA